jgi:dinuclear metal center YbgI/SA1388 family protein
MNVHDLLSRIDSILPPTSAVPGDAVGLHIDSSRSTVARCLVCLDVTSDVVREAIQTQCDCIIAFHPLLYRPLSKVDSRDRVGALVLDLIRADIALISVHTTFDTFPQGTNAMLADRLGIRSEGTLHTLAHSGAVGIGIVGSFDSPLSDDDLAQQLSNLCGSPVRWSSSSSGYITRIAIVGGSGMSFWDDVIASGVDAFVTADVKYHAFMEASGRVGIFDPGHYEMEQFVPQGIVRTLSQFIADTDFVATSISTNPLRYTTPSADTAMLLPTPANAH